MNFEFANAWLLYLLWVAPALGLAWHAMARTRERRLASFVSTKMQASLRPSASGTRLIWQIWMSAAALALVVLALARPRWGSQEQTVFSRGRDLMIVLDTSRSMMATDVRPTRLMRAKADIHDLVSDLKGDRAGLVVFRKTGVLLCPLTSDYSFFKQALDHADTSSAPPGETNIGNGIRKALHAFDHTAGSHKAIVLISDGEDLSGQALSAAAEASERGIPVFAVGIGSVSGSRIPDQGAPDGFVRHENQDVVTRLDNATLQAISERTRGAYVHIGTASTAAITLGDLYRKHLSRLAAQEREERFQRRYIERFQVFLFPAILLFLASLILSPGRMGRSRPSVAARTVSLILLSTFLTQVSIAATNSTPEAVPASPRDLARTAQDAFDSGRFQEAADMYLSAAEIAAPESQSAWRYNAALSLHRAGRFEQAVAILRTLPAGPGVSAASAPLLRGLALYADAGRRGTNTVDTATRRPRLLRDAGDAFRDALRAASAENDVISGNLDAVLRQLPEAEQEAKIAVLTQQYGSQAAGSVADAMLENQHRIMQELETAATNTSPSRIRQLEQLAAQQRANADLWIPLRARLLAEASQNQSVTNSQAVMQNIQRTAEAVQAQMADASERMRNVDDNAVPSAARAAAAVYGMWKNVASFQDVLKESMRRQTNAIDLNLTRTASPVHPGDPVLPEQAESANLTSLFTNRFASAVPEEGLPPPAPPPGVTNAPPAQGISKETRVQILSLADRAVNAQKSASTHLKSSDRPAALTEQRTAYALLEEIRKLLPKQNQQNENGQQQKQPQQKPPDKQKTPPEEKKPDQTPKPENEQLPDDVKRMLEKALQREREHEEEKQRRQIVAPPSMNVRDW